MDILLINPIIRVWEPPSFPLGLAYISRVLLEAGHHVEALDINAHRWTPNEVAVKIREDTFDVVGITCMLTEYNQVKWLCSLLRREHPSCTIILGGGLPSVVPELVLQETEADIAVVGEGESTVTEITDTLEKSGDLSTVRGIWYKKNGAIFSTPPRAAISSVDSIPFPSWDLFPIETYVKQGSVLGFDPPIRRMKVVTSRGCTYHCTYCDHSTFGDRFRSRSVDSVIEEMKLLRDRYGVKAISFVDDLFLLNKKRAYEFCDKVLSQGICMMWSCNGRVNLVDKDLLNKMRSAGCVMIGYGIESGSQTILNEMNKKATVEQAKRAIDLTWKSGITPFPYMLVGMPSETEDTIKETTEFCKEIGIVEGFGFLAPIPGTHIFSQAMEAGKITSLKNLVEKWEEWQKGPIVNLTSLPTERLIALKETAEKVIANHVVRKHKKLILRRLFYYYRVHGMAAIMSKLGEIGIKFLRRNFLKRSKATANLGVKAEGS